jgi:membrane protein DedA with SNARE-associated domain
VSEPTGTQQRAGPTWRRFVPWQGRRPTRVDLALLGAILGVVALGLALRPLKPFLIASHPIALEFLTGDLVAIGAAAAFARLGEAPLWLVILAGAVGMVKFDWLTWWTGRQWGEGIIRMFTTNARVLRFAGRATELSPWILGAAVLLAMLPGVPTAVVYAMAGWAGMRLTVFLLLDLGGAMLMSGLVAALGYWSGQRAVDVVLLVDKYATVVSLSMIFLALGFPLIKRWIRPSSSTKHAGQLDPDVDEDHPQGAAGHRDQTSQRDLADDDHGSSQYDETQPGEMWSADGGEERRAEGHRRVRLEDETGIEGKEGEQSQ